MNFSEIISELNSATSFDLFRLNSAITTLLADSKRVIEVKRVLRVGQSVEYFDTVENRIVHATVIKLNNNKLLVQNIDDKVQWYICYYMVNIDGVDVSIQHSNKQKGLAKNEVSKGDRVGFTTNDGRDLYGVVIRLNPKTVTIKVPGGKWRVAYSFLHKIHEQAMDALPPG